MNADEPVPEPFPKREVGCVVLTVGLLLTWGLIGLVIWRITH